MNQKRRADLDVICRKLNDMQEELYRIQRSEEKTYVRIPLIDFLPTQITSYRNTMSGMVTMERIVVRT